MAYWRPVWCPYCHSWHEQPHAYLRVSGCACRLELGQPQWDAVPENWERCLADFPELSEKA